MTLTRDKGRSKSLANAAATGAGQVRYDVDTYAWAVQQAGYLASGRLDLVDAKNISDEIGDVARRELRATRSAIRLIVQRLLRWDAQPQRRSRSWVLTVRTQRRDIERQIDDSPSLRTLLPKLTSEAYADARDGAIAETELPETTFPIGSPYSWDDIMNRPIDWPDQL